MRFSNYSKQSKSIINYIPIFLEYSKNEKNLSPKSIESYGRFLKLFVDYLKHSNKSKLLLPHQLSLKHIQEYKYYLSKTISHTSKRPITKVTQNLYLIALRALLSYFIKKNIDSLLPDKISLFKEDKSYIRNKFLDSSQIKKLLSAPDVSKPNGLRDRAILEVLISAGLKMSQIVSLNRNYYSQNVYFSKTVIYWLKKYLNSRKDHDKALFINYQGRRNAPRRLTDRSIERIIKKYITDNNLPLLTPEDLRNIYISNLFNQSVKIIHPSTHNVQIINRYKLIYNLKSLTSYNKRVTSLNWHIIENVINQEILWLKEKILIMPSAYRKDRLLQDCDNCLLRKLAILIVSGKIKAYEIRTKNGKDLWVNSVIQKNSLCANKSKHGKEWHRKMMDRVSNCFIAQNYKVRLEPILNYGRADLKAYNHRENIYIEIGTVSLFKLWYNFLTTKNTTFLIIPSKDYILKFVT